ncbi:MAG: hypothetical protein MUC55_09895 [Burkholderiales bacterium]|jgi:hypothetical protein|nr:hypothetical protein [Burkholderiales bacterium]
MTLRLAAGSPARFFVDAPGSPGAAGFPAWDRTVRTALAAHGFACASGSDDATLAASEDLGWSAHGALVLWAAYAEHPERSRPLMEPEEWHKDPAVLESAAHDFSTGYATLVRGAELWVPGDFDAVVEIPSPAGDVLDAGSVGGLERELDALNAATWRAKAAEVLGWRDTVDAASGRLEDLARRGFSMFFRVVSRARGKPLAVWLDY